MKEMIKKFCLLLAMGVVSWGTPLGMYSPNSALAEFYVGGMGGYVAPNDFDTTLSGALFPGSQTSFDGLNLKNSAMGGGKIGYYFPNWNWLGVETEAFYSQPVLKTQTVPGTGAGCGLGCTLIITNDVDLRVITWGVNAVVRYPGERIQPYVGAGLGVFFAELSQGGNSRSDNFVPGVNLFAGIRGFVTNSIAVFAEYKYNRATFDFGNLGTGLLGGGNVGFEGDYSANIAAAGVSFHFNE